MDGKMSSAKNYMVDNNIFLLTELNDETTNELIADLTLFVQSNKNKKGELFITINSQGGQVDIMRALIGLIKVAQMYGVKVTTYVVGVAASAASAIAIHGDRRCMLEDAFHYIHFGQSTSVITKASEIDKSYALLTKLKDSHEQLYLKNCSDLSGEQYNKIIEDGYGWLSAKECLKYGLCDEITEDVIKKRKR